MSVAVGLSVLSVSLPAGAEAPSGTTLTQVRQQLDDLETQQQNLAAQKATAQEKLTVAQNQLKSTQAQITAQKAQLAGLESQLVQIALQQYQDRGLNSTALLMTSTSSDNLLNYLAAMQQVSDTTDSLFTSLQLQQATLTDLQRTEQSAITSIQQEQTQLTTLEQSTQAKIAQTTLLLNQMTAIAMASSSSLAGVNIVGLGVADPSAVVPNPSPALKSPLSAGSWVETSPFGMRIHPITGVYSFHDGLDMGASCGTSVRAPANGFVMDYYWADSYGNRLVVDNGIIDGHHIVTSFNHLSATVAKPGDLVVQGQTIAKVGTTGDSTGCHLHYMIWSDGEVIDPAPYVGS